MDKQFRNVEAGPDFDRARSMIATPFQYIDIALDTANSNAVYDVSGDFLYVDPASTGVATLEFNNQYNDPVAPFALSPGWAARTLFKQIKLTWAAQTGRKLRLIYATGSNLIPPLAGTITTMDGGVVRTLAKQSFWTTSNQAAGGAGVNSYIQIWNPVTNTKSLVVTDVSLDSNVASLVQLKSSTASIANLGSQPLAKYMGGPASIAEMRQEANAAVLGVSVYAALQVPAAQTMGPIKINDPIIVPPGFGLLARNNTANADLRATFQFYEF